MIATCRRAVNGGKFKGSIQAQLDILLKAADSGFQLVDIEIQSAQELKRDQFAEPENRVGVILSFHDFKSTKKLEEQFAGMHEFPADFYKVVTDRHQSLRQRDHDEVSAGALRQARDGRAVHGRAGNHQPRSGSTGRQHLYLWLRPPRAKKPRPARSRSASCVTPTASRRSRRPPRFMG